jgi:hypothetical protein
METVRIFYSHLVHFTAVWYISWLCVVVIWYFFPVYVVQRKKSGNPAFGYQSRSIARVVVTSRPKK